MAHAHPTFPVAHDPDLHIGCLSRCFQQDLAFACRTSANRGEGARDRSESSSCDNAEGLKNGEHHVAFYYQRANRRGGGFYPIDRRKIPLSVHEVAIAALSRFLAQHTAEVVKNDNDGLFYGTDEVIERITGQKPRALWGFVTANMDACRKT